MRFMLSGGSVAIYYLTITTVLADVVGLPFQLALVIGYTTSICLHFLLQRFFVWVHEDEFALAVHHQVGRYLVVVMIQYGLTAASVALLPGALGLPTEVIYVATAALLATTNFLVMGRGVFHGSQQATPSVLPTTSDLATANDPTAGEASRTHRAFHQLS